MLCPKLSSDIRLYKPIHTHTHSNPSQPRTVWHTVYVRILHAIGDGTLWCTTCNRGRFVYEYDSSLITGDVTGARKYSSFVNVIYIRFAIDCTNSQGGDRPRFQNVPGLIVECHTRPRLEAITNSHIHTHTHTMNFSHGDQALFIFSLWITGKCTNCNFICINLVPYLYPDYFVHKF